MSSPDCFSAFHTCFPFSMSTQMFRRHPMLHVSKTEPLISSQPQKPLSSLSVPYFSTWHTVHSRTQASNREAFLDCALSLTYIQSFSKFCFCFDFNIFLILSQPLLLHHRSLVQTAITSDLLTGLLTSTLVPPHMRYSSQRK